MESTENNLQAKKVEALNPLLKFAAIAGVIEAIRNRIAKGDNINGQDKEGLTALMHAVRKQNTEAVSVLLSLDANSDIKNNLNKTAFDIASEAGFHEIVNLLISKKKELITPPNQDLIEMFAGDFDLGGWVYDEEINIPIHNGDVGIAVSAIQKSISVHRPINRDDDWSDVEIHIPFLKIKKEKLSPSDKFLLRELIYRGYSDGFISLANLEEIALDEHLDIDEVLLDTLVLFLQDLEFKIIESPIEAIRSQCDYEDTYIENIFEQAVYLIESHDFDEKWIYDNLSAPLINGKLLTHDDEIKLGKDIEDAYLNCLKSVSESKNAIELILEDFKKVRDGILDRNEIFDEKINLENQDESTEKFISDDSSIDYSEESEFSEENSDLIEFERMICQSDKVDNSKVLAFLLDSHIDFKYLQNLIFEGRLIDDDISKYIEIAVQARNKLVTSNLRLANHVAKSYRYTDMPYADLVQEAFIGLIKGAERFEYKKGFRFTTYATWWIRQSVGRMVQDKSRLIRLPVHIGELINKVERLEKTLVDLPISKRVSEISRVLGITERRTLAAKNAIFSTISMESEEEVDIELLESYDFPRDNTFDENQHSWMLRRTFENLFLRLEKKDAEIIKKRFGWFDGNPLTLEEVGDLYGVTRERIRQVEAKAMKKLRNAFFIPHISRFDNEVTKVHEHS